MVRESNGENALDLAAKRLDRAISQLEQRLSARGAGAAAGGLFAKEPSKLAAELDQARARERDLEAAGAEASAALGRAIAEIRKALNGQAPSQEA